MSGLRPIAIGYVSTPVRVGIGRWMRWQQAVESVTGQAQLPLLRIITDDQTTHGAGLHSLIATLRIGHVSVVCVPSWEHLSPRRDNTHDLMAQLLDLHFAVRVWAAERGTASPVMQLVDDVSRLERDPYPLIAGRPVARISSAGVPVSNVIAAEPALAR